jgi:hypothetical protein
MVLLYWKHEVRKFRELSKKHPDSRRGTMKGGGGYPQTPPRKLQKKVSNYNTLECDFNTHKSAFYTQSAIPNRTV